MQVYTSSAIAARYDVAIRVERAPTQFDLADFPPSRRKLAFDAEDQKDLAKTDELLCLCALPRIL